MNAKHPDKSHQAQTPELAPLYRWAPFGERITEGAHPNGFRNWVMLDTTGRVRYKITRDPCGLWTVNKRGRIAYRRRTEDNTNTLTVLRGAQYLELEDAKRAIEAAELARVDQLRATAQTEAVQ